MAAKALVPVCVALAVSALVETAVAIAARSLLISVPDNTLRGVPLLRASLAA
jgi:hypothetical protein